jgi:Type I phosphodiesterase / nucleotide pyrophosphatase
MSFPGGFRQTAAESIDLERRRAAAAGALLARAHPALAVYYTQAVDEISHWNWPSARDDLDRSVIASAYEEIDRSVGELLERFGPADAVVLASDHGWEFNPYQHERMPHGVLVVADGRSSGFGGTAMVGAVAPTVLALLKLPRDAAGLAPIAGTPDFGVADYSAVAPLFVSDGAVRPDDGARQRLKSLGYTGW